MLLYQGGQRWAAPARIPVSAILTLGNGVVIGTGAKVLGNIRIGDHSRRSERGRWWLRPVPDHSTVVGGSGTGGPRSG